MHPSFRRPFMRRLFAYLSLFASTFVPLSAVGAPPSDYQDGIEQPSASQLVQGVIDAENRIRDVQSLYLRFEGVWTRTPESIADERASLQRQFSGEEIEDECRGPRLLDRCDA